MHRLAPSTCLIITGRFEHKWLLTLKTTLAIASENDRFKLPNVRTGIVNYLIQGATGSNL